MPLEAAVVYFMIGTSYTELNNLNGALEAFNNAIKVDPDYAEVSNGLLPCTGAFGVLHYYIFCPFLFLHTGLLQSWFDEDEIKTRKKYSRFQPRPGD
jgi:tetratricopeptide (TPR) repeat protein